MAPGAPRPAAARPRLAALAHVRAASAGDHLDDRRPALVARLALAEVDQELVLERPLHPIGVAEVVDRRAARRQAGAERLADPGGERLALLERQRPSRAQRVDARAEQRLVGVD